MRARNRVGARKELFGRNEYEFSPDSCLTAESRGTSRVPYAAALLFAFVLVLAGCGGGSTNPASSVTPPVAREIPLSGAVVAANVSNASVDVFLVQDGVQGTSPVVSTTTDDQGAYELTIPDCPDPCIYLVEASGGEYTDEATGEVKSIDADNPIRAAGQVAADEETATAAVTPLTEVAIRQAEEDGDLDGADIEASNTKVAELFLGVTGDEAADALLSTVPADATTEESAVATDAARVYGLLLAAVSLLGELQEAIADLQSDVADGALDAQADNLKQATQTFLVSDMNNSGIESAGVIDNLMDAAATGDVAEIAPSSDKNITGIQLEGALTVSFDLFQHSIEVVMPFGTEVAALTPKIGVSLGASIEPSSDAAQDFTAPVSYTVTAADGSAQVWQVSVVALADARSPLARINDFVHASVKSVIVNAGKRAMVGEVEAGGLALLDAVTDLSELFTVSENAQIEKLSGSFVSGYVQYTVTAENGTEQIWSLRLRETGRQDQPAMSFSAGLEIQKTLIDDAFVLQIEGGLESIPILFASSDPSVASVNEDTSLVTLLKPGTTTISATKAAASVDGVSYQSAAAHTVLSVTKATSNLAYNALSKTYGDGSFVPTATSSGDGAITFTSSNTDVISINAEGALVVSGAGSARITANQAETNDYLSAVATFDVTVAKAASNLAYSAVNKTFGDANVVPTGTSSRDGAITFTSSNTDVISINAEGELVVSGAGSARITANQAEIDNYLSAVAAFDVTVAKAAQSAISFEVAPTSVQQGGAYTEAVNGGNGSGPISFSTSNANVASVTADGLVTALAIGDATISATKSGDSNFLEGASISYLLSVDAVPPPTCVWDEHSWNECNWQ